jgi:hypothetical protein
LTNKFNTANLIIREIFNIVREKELAYLDATIYYSERSGIELETLAEIIQKNPKLKASIQQEAEDLNFLKRTVDRLPF